MTCPYIIYFLVFTCLYHRCIAHRCVATGTILVYLIIISYLQIYFQLGVNFCLFYFSHIIVTSKKYFLSVAYGCQDVWDQREKNSVLEKLNGCKFYVDSFFQMHRINVCKLDHIY